MSWKYLKRWHYEQIHLFFLQICIERFPVQDTTFEIDMSS